MSFLSGLGAAAAAAVGGSAVLPLVSTGLAFGNTLADVYTQKKNRESQEEINAANIAAQKEINQSQLDFAKQMTQAQWERDDNSYQRQVADLAAAGLSPLAATNGASVTPAMSYNPQAEGVAQAYRAQAPQFDLNALMESMRLAEQVREHDDKMIRQDQSLSLQADKLQQTARSLDIKDKAVAASVQKIANDFSIASAQVDLARRQLKQTADIAEQRLINERLMQNDRLVNDAMAREFGKGFHTKPYFDLDEYAVALESWGSRFQIFVETKIAQNKLESHGYSVQGGINVLGTGGNAGTNSQNTTARNENYEDKLLLEFTARDPKPTYVYRSR